MQKKFNQVEDELNPLKLALEKCKTAFKIVFVFAFVINLLMLVTPLYSLLLGPSKMAIASTSS